MNVEPQLLPGCVHTRLYLAGKEEKKISEKKFRKINKIESLKCESLNLQLRQFLVFLCFDF